MATLISTGRTWVSSNKTGAAPSRGGEWQWGARPDGPDEASQTKPDLSRLIWPVIETDNPQGGQGFYFFGSSSSERRKSVMRITEKRVSSRDLGVKG